MFCLLSTLAFRPLVSARNTAGTEARIEEEVAIPREMLAEARGATQGVRVSGSEPPRPLQGCTRTC